MGSESGGSARVQGVHSLLHRRFVRKADSGWSCQRCCFLLVVSRRRDSVWLSAWTTPSLSQPNSNVSGSNWKLSDGAAMSDATIGAIAAATLDAATQPRLSLSLPVTSGERNEAFALLPVASSCLSDPEAQAGAAAATDSEGEVYVLLVDAELEGGGTAVRGAKLAPVLLVLYAAESDLKGHVSIEFLPVPLESAFLLTYLGRFDGWMLENVPGEMQATAASWTLHWKSGLGLVDHFKTLVPGLRASSSDHVCKGMPKVKEDQRSTVSLVSRCVSCRFLRLGPWCCHCMRLCSASSGRRDTSPSSIATTSGMPSLRRPCLLPKQQPHLKVPAVVSSQVPSKRDRNSSQFKKSSFSQGEGRLVDVGCQRGSGRDSVACHWY